MKKFFLLLAVAVAAVAAQAMEVTLFDETNTSSCSPVYAYNNDVSGHATQTILPASYLEAMAGATINSMKFYVADANGSAMTSGKLAVSVGTTEMNSFYNTLITEGLTQVAEITLVGGETEFLINFTQPWLYEGGNMVIEFKVAETGNYTTVNFYGLTATGASNVIYGQWTKYTTGFYPKTTFDFDPVEDMATISANALDFGQLYPDQDAEPQTFTIKNVGVNAFTPVFSTIEAPFSVTPAPAQIASGESMTFTVTFAPTALGEYNQTLAIDCGAAGQFEVALSGSQVEVPAEIVVADGEVTNKNVPIHVESYEYAAGNNQAQMIYNADLLSALVGKKINSIKFHYSAPLQALNGGKVQLSVKVVDQDAFESTTAITDLTVVATATPAIGDSELVFTIDEPFVYEGGNLAIEALVIEPGAYSFRDSFVGVSTTDYVSYAHFNDMGWESHVYKFLPKATFSYVKEDAPVVNLGDVNGDGFVNLTDVTLFISAVINSNYDDIIVANADINGDNELNLTDVTMLISLVINAAN